VEGAERRELLAVIRRALRREAEMLAVRPELNWQQLHNRVQWAGSVVTDVLDRERRRQPPARTWFWLQSPPTESSALMGVLGNTGSAFAFTPDGSTLIVARDGFLQYSDLLTGMPTRTVELNGGAERPVRGCAVSPDGSFMVTATVQGLQLWRLPTGELLRTLEGGELADDNGASSGAPGTRTGPPHLDTSPTALPCAVSPDTSFVVGTGPDHDVRIWDTATGQLRVAFTGHTEPVTACAVSVDGSLVVSASADGTVRLWDPATGWLGTIAAVFHGGRRRPAAAPGSAAGPALEDPARAGTGSRELWVGPVNGCAIGPDASFLAGVSEDMVTVWDLPSGQVRWSDQHVGGAKSCAVSPDGTLVVSGGERGNLRMWDASSGAELCALSGHTGPVYACAVSPDATIIASRADDGIRLWDARARGEQESLEGHGKRITACRFDPAGERLAWRRQTAPWWCGRHVGGAASRPSRGTTTSCRTVASPRTVGNSSPPPETERSGYGTSAAARRCASLQRATRYGGAPRGPTAVPSCSAGASAPRSGTYRRASTSWRTNRSRPRPGGVPSAQTGPGR